jgi:TetR/AcrR family transcriptional repressor of mexJK operon
VNSAKDRIADCFEKHFSHFGFKKTSVDEVAGELRVSKKTIYQYFATKEEIYYFIIGKIARGFSNDLEAKLTGIPAYQEKLSALLKMICSETRCWLKSKPSLEFKYQDDLELQAFQAAYTQLIRKLINDGNEAGEFAKIPVDITARFINGLISESIKVLSASPKINVEDDLIQAVFKLLR